MYIFVQTFAQTFVVSNFFFKSQSYDFLVQCFGEKRMYYLEKNKFNNE